MTKRMAELRALRTKAHEQYAALNGGSMVGEDEYLETLATARLEILKSADALIDCAEALRPLLKKAMNSVCQHEETHRGGTIWEICDACGSKWADDEGGKPEWVDPPEWTAAIAALAKLDN